MSIYSYNTLTDEKLFYLCQRYGENARLWRQKFLGLLPEVFKRKLYVRKGFSSIFEFAAKLAGVSEEQVSRVLNLERKFQDKPDLHKALVNGEVSVNKLRKIVSIATPENQKILLEQAKILPQKAVETLTRDEKMACSGRATRIDNQMQISQAESGPILSSEVKIKLLELQQKGIDINELILNAIKKREEEIANLKQKLADEQEGKNSTRYISIKIKRILNQEYGTKCSVPSLRAGAMPKRGWPNCQKEAEQIHHELPFAMVKNHSPFSMKPLCKEHHQIAHGFQLAYQKNRAVNSRKV